MIQISTTAINHEYDEVLQTRRTISTEHRSSSHYERRCRLLRYYLCQVFVLVEVVAVRVNDSLSQCFI